MNVKQSSSIGALFWGCRKDDYSLARNVNSANVISWEFLFEGVCTLKISGKDRLFQGIAREIEHLYLFQTNYHK